MTHSSNELPGRPLYELANEFNSRFGASEIFRIMRRHLGIMLFVIIAGMTATALWLSYQHPVYSSTAAILLRSQELPSETVHLDQSPGIVTSTQVFTQAEVLRSQWFASRLADRLDLLSDARFNPAIAEPLPPTILERVLQWLGLFDPEALGDIPEARQRAEVIDRLLYLYSVGASEKHNVMDIRAQHSDPVLAAQIANETARLYIDLQLTDQLDDLDRDIQFMRERSQEISANLSEQQMRMISLMMENQLLDDSVVRTLVAERARLQIRQEASGSGTQGEDEIRARIAEIDAELQRRVGAEIRLTESRTVMETQTSRLDAVSKRLDELEAQRQSPTPNVRQISIAQVPSLPSGPNAKSTLAVSFVLFSLLAVVVALLRESLDDRVLYKEDAETLTRLNVIASLPRLSRSILRRHLAPHHCIAKNECPGYSNSVRALVSVAMEGAKPGRAPVVLIGSAKPAEGKSSIASSMAVAAMMDDLKVLLIDFDIHQFGLTKLLGVGRGQATFSEVLSSQKAFAAAVRKTDYVGISLLNFRPGSAMSRKALWSDTAQEIIETMRTTNDLVIVDAPPFLASEEVSRLQGIVDKAILINRWGEASRETLAQTARMMRQSGLPVIGIAINGINARAAHSYGYLAYLDDYYRRKDRADA